MGSMLWAVDMLLNDMIRPMFNAYQFKDYETAANLLQQLNKFLIGFGSGVSDLPVFNRMGVDVHDRLIPQNYFKKYYETYSQDVLVCMGKYVKDTLSQIKLYNQFPQVVS